MIVIADTSAVLSAFVKAEHAHDLTLKVLESETFVLSPLVLTELQHLAGKRHGFGSARLIIGALLERIEEGDDLLAEITFDQMKASYRLQGKYEALRLDLADCVGVVLADVYETDRIFTLDQRDFRAITPLTPKFDAFKIFPADY